jgi:hypothetical protein
MLDEQKKCRMCDDTFFTDYAAWVRGCLKAQKENTSLCDKCKELSMKKNPWIAMIAGPTETTGSEK